MRTPLFFVFCLYIASLSAQYEKGTWYLNADSKLSSANNYGFFSQYGEFNLGGGYFVANNLMVGLSLEGAGYIDLLYSNFNPYVRYYVTPKNSRTSFFADLGVYADLSEVSRTVSLTGGIGLERQLVPGVLGTARLGVQGGSRRLNDVFDLQIRLNTLLGKSFGGDDNVDFVDRTGSLLLDAEIASVSTVKVAADWSRLGNFQLLGAYFLTERFLLDGQLSYGASKIEFGSEVNPRGYNVQSLTAGAGGRFLINEGRRVQPFIGTGLVYEHTVYNTTGAQISSTTPRSLTQNNLFWYGQGGMLYHLTPQLALEIDVRYNNLITGAENVDNNFSGGVGLRVNLGKKQ